MKDVIQELILVDKSGEHHLVYIHKVEMVDGKLVVDFSSTSQYNDKLDALVNEAMSAQIKEHIKNIPKPWWKIW